MPHRYRADRPLGWTTGLRGAVLMAVAMLVAPAHAQASFPFDRELLLDAAPMRGSKQVPSLDIATNGAAEIVLWCNTVRAQLVVAGDTITILTGPKTERQCPPERMRGDDAMLSALTQATHWRREGDALILSGGPSLRFRLQTN